jgi:hypothetical protein
MSTTLVVPDAPAMATTPIPENKAIGIIFKEDRSIVPAKEQFAINATHYLMMTKEELGGARDYTVGRSYHALPDYILCNPNLFKCVDLLDGGADRRELFLRCLVAGIDGAQKSNKDFQADELHMIKFTLRSLMTVKRSLGESVYDLAHLASQDAEKITEYFARVPVSADSIDLDNMRQVDAFENDAAWRIAPVTITPAQPATGDTPAVEAKVEYATGFRGGCIKLKVHTCGERPATRKQKRAREDEDLKEKLEEATEVACKFKKLTAIPGAVIFTFAGRYDVSKASFVEDVDGTQSMVLPYAN